MKKPIITAFACALFFASCGTAETISDTAAETATEINTETTTQTETTTEYIPSEEDIIHGIYENMTPEKKIAQLILARWPNMETDTAETEEMSAYSFGGYVLFASDFKDKDKESAAEFISEIKANSDITPFIAVDEEGGDINRISKFPQFRETPFPSVMDIWNGSGMDGIISVTAEKAELLTFLGVNMNLAPVADMAPEGAYIYDRTAGCDPQTTSEIISQIVQTSGENGLISCLKHFPGYGDNVDTHTGIAHDSRTHESFSENDFLPFSAGFSGEYTPAVMVNHNIVECFDDTCPASLSAEVHNVLRNELGFNGVIITDDMSMDGVAAYTDETSRYVAALLCGNDLLCVSDYETAYNDILSAYNLGIISDDILNEHCERVLKMKFDYKLI